MKYEKRGGDLQVDSTDEVISMGIDQNAMAHIMNVLTDLYSDPILAVVREYSTNALDAHIEAGNDDPIEITINDDWFIVRDFGTGMDSDDIRNVYSRYGTSTKRDSNDVVGMLGLGSKSALTYTNEFWVVGIKNGISTQVAVGRDSEGVGFMNIVLVSETDLPDGVEVSIPIKPGESMRFESTAKNFYRFWRNHPVLLNNESPERIKGITVTDNIILVDSFRYESYVVMGNVPYPTNRSNGTVSYVAIGDVDIAPSREALQMTPKTNQTLSDLFMEFNRDLQQALRGHVATATTPQEAIEFTLAVSRHKSNLVSEWQGETIPSRLDAPNGKEFISVPMAKGYSGMRRNGASTPTVLPLSTLTNSIFITGYDAKFSQYHRAKLDQWWSNTNQTINSVILCNEHPLPFFAFPQQTFSWDDVKKTKITNNKPVTETVYRSVYVKGQYELDMKLGDIPTDTPIFYTLKNEDMHGNTIAHALGTTDFVVVRELGQNQIKKFKREFPNARHVWDFCSEAAKKWIANLDKSELEQYTLNENHYYEKSWLVKLDHTQINDPALVSLINLLKTKSTSKIEDEHSLYRYWTSLPKADVKSPLKLYPLMRDVTPREHIYIYVNAVYETRKDLQS